MPISKSRKARNSRIFFAIFGSCFLLPGLGIFTFKALPELKRWLSGAQLYSAEKESLMAALIIGIVFSLVGGGLVYLGLKKPTDDPALLDSGTPWMARKAWASPVIKDSFALSGGFIWAFTIIWNLMSTPALLAIPKELAKGNQLIWFAALFPIVGLFFIGLSIRKTLEWRRFGQMRITLDPHPGAIGGQVGGTIYLKTPLPPGTDMDVSLDCVHHYQRSKSPSQSIVWQHRTTIEPMHSSRSTMAPFVFDVPAGLPHSQFPDTDYYNWTLHVSARLPGADLSRQIEVPVFATGATTSSAHSPKIAPCSSFDKPQRQCRAAMHNPVEIVGEHRGQGRWVGLTVGLFFTLFSAGMAYFIGYREEQTTFLVFGLGFGAIGVLILVISLLAASRKYKLKLANPILALEQHTLFGAKSLTTPFNDIVAFDTKSRGSVQMGGRHYQFFDLMMKLKNGEETRLGEKLSRQQAEGFIRELNEIVGLSPDQ